jgi:hypothetical protein
VTDPVTLRTGRTIPLAETSDEALADEIKPRPEPIMQRRADALVRMAQGYGSDEASNCGGDRFLVHVHTDMETLKADGTGAEAQLQEFGNISAETARRLACDAGLVHWLELGEGSAVGGSESGGHASSGSHHAGHALNYWPLSAIPGFRGTGASLHIGRSQPSLAFAAPVHPCTLAARHAAFHPLSSALCSAAMAVVVSRAAPAHALSMLTISIIGPMGVKLR